MKEPVKTPPATLSPAAECWWEWIGDCAYLVLSCPGACPGLPEGSRVELTDVEAEVLRDLLNNPEWWNDKDQLRMKPKGVN